MNLQLTRPLAALDIEGTGLDTAKDRIVEISIVILQPSGERTVKTRRINPEMPIPAEATAVHGITDADVANQPTFSLLAKSLFKLIEGCDILGFGSNRYDIPLLFNEFNRAGILWDYSKSNFIDAGNIYKINEPRDLTAAVKFYCGEDHAGAHGAEADALATLNVFLAQAQRYDLPEGVPAIALHSNYDKRVLDLSGKFTYDDSGNVVYNFGPHKGTAVKDEPGFMDWMLSKDFPPDTVNIILKLQQQLYQSNNTGPSNNDGLPF